MTKSTKKAKSNPPGLQLILDNEEGPTILLDHKFDVVCLNDQCRRFYYNFFKKRISAGRNIRNYLMPGMEQASKNRLEEAINGVAQENEFTFHDPTSNQVRSYVAHYKPLRDAALNIVGVLITYRENSLPVMFNKCFDFKSDLKACLKKLMKELCHHFDQRAAEIWIVNEDEKLVHLLVTQAQGTPLKSVEESLFLSKGEDLPGKSWQRMSPVFIKDIKTDSIYQRKKFAERNQLNSVTSMPVIHKNKVAAILLFYNKPSPSAAPVIIRKDILALLGTEIKRKKSEDNLILLFKYTPELLCIAGQDGYFRKVNPAFTQLLGYTEEELLSQPFTRFVHPDDVNNTINKTRELVSGPVIHSFENRYLTKTNEWKWISWSTSKVLNDEVLVFAYGKDITEEKKLRNLLYSTGKLAKIGSWEFDLVNNKTFWSPGARQIYEVDEHYIPPLDLDGDRLKEGVDRNTFRKLIQNAINSGTGWSQEFQIVSVPGNIRWVRMIAETEFRSGKCIRLFGSIQDIHDKKTAKLEIEKVLQEKKDILESIGDGFFTLDNDWTVTFWNRQMERMTGSAKEDVVGHNFWEVYPEKVNTPFHTHCTKASTTQEAQHFEAYYETEHVRYEISAYPNKNGLSVYFKDATTRILMDEKIRQANERFELIAKATKDAIWDYELKTRAFTHVGDGFTRLFGYEQNAQSEDMDFLKSIIHPDDAQRVFDAHAIVIKDTSQNFWEGEYRVKTNLDKYVHVLECCYILRDQQGKAIRMMGANQDITYRKEHAQSLEKLNAELEKYALTLAASNAELEQFAYVASHDLQEPLRMVTSFLKLLEKNYKENLDERGRQYIHFAVDGAQRMRNIIMDLLEYSRVARFSKEKEEVNLHLLVEEILLLFRNQITEKQAVVQIDPLPVIYSHRTPLGQVFQNLIGNALKYTRPGIAPQIKIAYTETEAEYRFEISDNGVGVPHEHFEKIFVIFQRLYNKDEFEGTGLGLSVCKRIVETLGGKIWVESDEKEGSSFYFTVPRHPQ